MAYGKLRVCVLGSCKGAIITHIVFFPPIYINEPARNKSRIKNQFLATAILTAKTVDILGKLKMMMIVILVYCVVSVLMPTRPSLHLAFFAPPSTPLLSPQKILPICEFNGGPQWNLKIKRAQLLTIEKWDNLAIFKLVAVKQEIQIEPLQAAKAAARELWNVITQFFIRLFAWPDFFFALQQNISQSSSSDFFSPKYL